MSVKTDVTELVVAAQSGDINAFNELYNQSAPDLKYVGYSILHKKEDVEDALQETYITIYRSFSGQGISPIHDPGKFQPWARQIMRNICLNLIDHQKRKAGKDDLRPMTSEDGQLGMDKIDNCDEDLDFSPADVAETQYVRSLLNDALAEIPEIRQTCLALHQQGLKYREIGEKLDLPEGTVKSHVRYAKAQLKKIIKEIEDEEGVQLHGVVLLRGPKEIQALVRAYSKPSWISAKTNLKPKEPKRKKITLSTSARHIISVVTLAVIIAVVSIILSMLPEPPRVETDVPKTVQTQEQDPQERANKRLNVQDSVETLSHEGEVETAAEADPDADNQYYNPNATVSGVSVHLYPYHLWYDHGNLNVDCYIVNSTPYSASQISLYGFSVRNNDMTIAESKEETFKGLTLEPDQYVTRRIVFPKGSYKKGDLTQGLHFTGGVRYLSASEEDYEDDHNKRLSITNDKISGAAYAKDISNMKTNPAHSYEEKSNDKIEETEPANHADSAPSP